MIYPGKALKGYRIGSAYFSLDSDEHGHVATLTDEAKAWLEQRLPKIEFIWLYTITDEGQHPTPYLVFHDDALAFEFKMRWK